MIAKVRCLAILNLAHLSRPSLRNRYKGLPHTNLVHVIFPSPQHYILNHCVVDIFIVIHTSYMLLLTHQCLHLNQPFRGAKTSKTFRKLVQVMDLDAFEVDDLVIVRDCLGNALVGNVGVLDRGLHWIS